MKTNKILLLIILLLIILGVLFFALHKGQQSIDHTVIAPKLFKLTEITNSFSVKFGDTNVGKFVVKSKADSFQLIPANVHIIGFDNYPWVNQSKKFMFKKLDESILSIKDGKIKWVMNNLSSGYLPLILIQQPTTKYWAIISDYMYHVLSGSFNFQDLANIDKSKDPEGPKSELFLYPISDDFQDNHPIAEVGWIIESI